MLLFFLKKKMEEFTMKSKKISRKLNFNKETVSNLSLENIKGGLPPYTYYGTCTCTAFLGCTVELCTLEVCTMQICTENTITCTIEICW